MPELLEYDLPTELPAKSAKELFRIISGGLVATETKQFLTAGWIVVGYLLGTFGPGETFASALAGCDGKPCDEEGCVAALKAMAEFDAASETKAALPIPVKMLLGYLLQKLIEQLSKTDAG